MTGKMNIGAALNNGIEHTRVLLFQRFDMARWICFGVIIFIELLFGNGGLSWVTNRWGLPGPAGDLGRAGGIGEYIRENTGTVAGIALVALTLVLLWVVFSTWLTSRGQLMMVHAVSSGSHRIDEAWSRARPQHRSLFLFRLALALVAVVSYGVLGGIGLLLVVGLERTTGLSFDTLWRTMWPLVVASGIVWFALWAVNSLTRNFVVPLMYLRKTGVLDAWGEFRGIAARNVVPILILYFARVVLFIALGVLSFFVGCFTCILGFLPVIHHTLLSPLYVFDRAFSIFAIETLGPEYQMVRFEEETLDPFGEQGPRDMRY